MTNKSFTISVIILLSTVGLAVAVSQRAEPVVVKTNLEKLPTEILGFKATEDFFPDSVYKELNADKHVYRHYRNAEGKQVDLYIGYYGTRKGGRTGHNPFACLPGSGWGIIETRMIRVRTDYYSNGADVNYFLAQRGEEYQVMLHWYQSGGTEILATGIQQNIHRFVQKIVKNRNDGAFIQISVGAKRGDIEKSTRLLVLFSELLMNLIPEYWPTER